MVSRVQGWHALPLIVCLLCDHFLFTKSRHLNLKLKPLMPSTGHPQGSSLMGAVASKDRRLSQQDSWRWAGQTQAEPRKTFGLGIPVPCLRASCCWVTQAFFSRCHLCLFLQRKQNDLAMVCFPLCSNWNIHEGLLFAPRWLWDKPVL